MPVGVTRAASGQPGLTRAARAMTTLALRLVLVLALAWPSRAVAATPALTEYERARVDEAAQKLGLSPEPVASPDGKLIERIDIVVIDVFDESDPVPKFFNVFHATTRERIVRRELLFASGDRLDLARLDESARNLRKLRQLSLVVIQPLAGSAPDRVRVLVLVKDVWSLRLNYDVRASDRGLTYLVINPSEENLGGTHTSLGGLFVLDPGTYSFGFVTRKSRIFGSDITASLSANVIYGREKDRAEGSFGSFTYGAPLTRADQRWAWGTGVYYVNQVERRYQGSRLQTYDAPSTPENEALPIAFRSEWLVGGFEVVRSFGYRHKLDLSLGVAADRRYYRYTPPPGTSPEAEADFRDAWVPVSDTRAGPFVQLHAHEQRYLRTNGLETLGLQEDYALGPAVLLRAYPASTALGSTRDLVGVVAALSYTFPLGNGLLRVLGSNRVEVDGSGRNDADVLLRAHLALPKTTFFRLVADGVVGDRFENYLNRNYELGGDGRLRGYPPAGFEGSFVGPAVAAVNVELRTASIDLFSVQSGLAAFYDAGHAAERLGELSLHQSAGVGIRMVFPQFNRVVARLDWAFPFTPAPGYRTFPGAAFLTFEQAFGMPELMAPTVMNPKETSPIVTEIP